MKIFTWISRQSAQIAIGTRRL